MREIEIEITAFAAVILFIGCLMFPSTVNLNGLICSLTFILGSITTLLFVHRNRLLVRFH